MRGFGEKPSLPRRSSFTGTSVLRREYSIRLQDAADVALSRKFEYHKDPEAQRLLL